MCRSLNNEFTWIRSDKTSQCLPLHQTIAMSGVILTYLQGKFALVISYDAFNPAVKNEKSNVFNLRDVFWYNQNEFDALPVL